MADNGVALGEGPSGLQGEAHALALPAASPGTLPLPFRARALPGERLLGRTLRGGAILSGGLFGLSLLLELLPVSLTSSVLIGHLRQAGASALLATPVARLGVAGVSLGVRGEWRYLAYAAGILALLALAVGAGLGA